MSLNDEMGAAGAALRQAAEQLAGKVKEQAQGRQRGNMKVDRLSEAESLGVTCVTVLEKDSSLLGVVGSNAVVGKALRVGESGQSEDGRVRNGFDALALIWLVLIFKAKEAVPGVHKTQDSWFVAHNRSQAFEQNGNAPCSAACFVRHFRSSQ